MHATFRHGYSLIGVLITMALIVVLMAISLTAVNDAISGSGNTKGGTVHSMEDKLNLSQLYASFLFAAQENGGSMLVPSDFLGGRDPSLNTTANIYSAFIMQQRIPPDMLISANERSRLIWADDDYDYTKYDPSAGVFWDPSFSADLEYDSNVSFAHVPLFGTRADHWRKPKFATTFPIMGTRGPKDGVHDPTSYTYGEDGTWAGHAVFGDGHVEFLTTFTPGSVTFARGSQHYADNIFAFDDSEMGVDAILTFTKMLDRRTIEVQHD